MHAGRETNISRGGIAAISLPIILGLAQFGMVVWVFWGNNDIRFYEIMREYSLIYGALCFLLLPPLVAFFTGLHLKRISDLIYLQRWKTVFFRAILYASVFQFIFYVILAVLLDIHLDGVISFLEDRHVENGTTPQRDYDLNAFKIAGIQNLIVWGLYTLPLTALGATLFLKITKFPADRTVF